MSRREGFAQDEDLEYAKQGVVKAQKYLEGREVDNLQARELWAKVEHLSDEDLVLLYSVLRYKLGLDQDDEG